MKDSGKIAAAVLVVLAVVLMLVRYRHTKNGYTAGIGNFEIPGENPDWWFGGVDAGLYGDMGAPLTPQQASVIFPQLRRQNQIAAAKRRRRMQEARAIVKASGTKSKFASDPSSPDFDWASAVCGEPWDPAAVAESQALSTLGSIMQPARAEGNLETVLLNPTGPETLGLEQVAAMGVRTP